MNPNEKTVNVVAQASQNVSHRKSTNGPSVPPNASAHTAAEAIANAPSEAVTEAKAGKGKKMTADEMETLRAALRALFKKYEAADAALEAVTAKILEAKRARSKVVEEIVKASPDRKSFKDTEGKVYIVMSREDKNEDSPSFGETFYYFRVPGSSQPFEI